MPARGSTRGALGRSPVVSGETEHPVQGNQRPGIVVDNQPVSHPELRKFFKLTIH